MAEENQLTPVGVENQHGIKVFGATTVAPETNQSENDNIDEQQESQEESLNDSTSEMEQKETSSEIDVNENKQESQEESENQEQSFEEKKETFNEDSKKPSLEINFGDSEIDENEQQSYSDNKQETVSVTREVVLDFLKNNGFEDINTLSDLSQPETLPDEVAKFKSFHEETGRGISDFYNLQKDWKSEPKESTIKEYLRLKHPELDESQIDTQFDVFNVTEEDEEQLSSRELNRAKAEFDKTYSEAVSFLSKKTKEYQVPLENVQPTQQVTQPSKEDVAKAHEPYWKERDKFLKNFNEIKFNVGGIGDIKIEIDEDDKRAITQRTETVDSMISSWQNEDKSVNHKKLVPDNAWAIPSVREKMLKSIIEQTHTLTLEQFSKQNRNVDLDDLNKKEGGKKETNNGALVKIGESKKANKESFGTPIVR